MNRSILLWSGLLVFAGCGGNLTPGGFGDVSVTVSGDATPGAFAAVAPSQTISAASPALASEGEAEGELRAQFDLYLVTAAGADLALSPDELEVQVDLKGQVEADAVTRVTIPADLYTGLKIVFAFIQVEVSGGLVVDGVPIVGEVEIEMKDTTLVVTKPLYLDVEDGTSATLLVDLAASTWLDYVSTDLQRVAEEVFTNAITVAVLP